MAMEREEVSQLSAFIWDRVADLFIQGMFDLFL